jgi:hypothetical protein
MNVAKSQLRDGRYVPATKLTEQGRTKQREALQSGSLKRLRQVPKGAPAGRGMSDAYKGFGVQPGLADALQERVRRSKVHRNVQYGSSVPSALEEKIDAEIKREVLRGAKRPIVFHYGKTSEQAIAAATGSHSLVGNKGRVILNSREISMTGRLFNAREPHAFADVINHETAHAQTHGKQPLRFIDLKNGNIRQIKALGEEARADGTGVQGRGLYERNGFIRPEHELQAAERQSKDPLIQDAARGHRHYKNVHRQVQDAKLGGRVRKPNGSEFKPNDPNLKNARRAYEQWAYEPKDPRKEFYDRVKRESAGPRPGPPKTEIPRVRSIMTNRTALGVGMGAAILAGGVGAAAHFSRGPRDGDGDGIVREKEKAAMSKSVEGLFSKAREKNGDGGGRIAAATAGAAGVTSLGAAATATNAHQGLQPGRGLSPEMKGGLRQLRSVSRKTAVAAGATAVGAAGISAYKRNRVKKNMNVNEVFSKARGEVSKLEPETKKGFKVGGAIGAGINGGLGAAAGTAVGGPRMGAISGVTNAISGGIVGGGIGAGAGALKASGRLNAKKKKKA